MTLYQYTGTGSISNSSNLIGRKTFDYNQNSIFDNSPEDYQLITNNFTSSDNYGEVTQLSGQTLDYFSITETPLNTLVPFGGITLGGSAITQPNYRLYFSGAAVEKAIYSPDNTSGTLFSFGEKVERRTHSYNESSIENTEEDYGSVTQITSQGEDYQLISSLSGITVEYGFITEQTGGTISPFGSLTFSGSAITQSNYRLYFSGSLIEKVIYSPDNTSGTLFSFGQKVESFTFDYNESSSYSNSDDYGLVSLTYSEIDDYGLIGETSGTQPEQNYGLITESVLISEVSPFGSIIFGGSAFTAVETLYTQTGSGTITLSGTGIEKFTGDTPDNTQLFTISGVSTSKQINDYVSGGTLFSFGEKVERRTYNYNLSSFSDIAEDYQLITSSPTEFEEFGFINSSISNGTDDYGRVGGLTGGSIPPFGTIVLSGSSTISFDKGGYSASGTITLSGTALESLSSQTPENTQLFQISGTALDSSINVHVGIGTLLKFGEKIERRTYDYNETSVVLYDTLDYQSISSTPNESNDDYGLLINLADGIEDYGFLVGFGATESLYPFGSLTLSGSVSDVKETDSYVGLGTIFISGSSVTRRTGSEFSTGIIIVSGSAIEKDVDSYVGLGTIFVSGTVLESFTESTYIGSGSITLSGTGIEKFTGDTPDNTQLFQISGTAVEKDVDSYVGVETIFLSGSAIEKDVDSYVGLGTIFVSGQSLESFAKSTYIGSGSITLSGTATEKFTGDTPDNTQLFQISGTAVKKDVDSYVGVGNLTVFGELVHPNIDYTPHYGIEKNIGIGTTGIQIYGQVDDSAQRIARGTGTIFINGLGIESKTVFIPVSGIGTGFIGGNISISSGIAQTHYYSPIYPRNAGILGSGIGTIRINDDQGLTITRAVLPYFARGTIFVSGNAAESFSESNYPGTGLYRFSGIASTREIAVYTEIGSGTITLSQTLIEKSVDSYVGFGSITISGSRVDLLTKNYSGSGFISGLSGSTEAYSAQTPENTQLFQISGSSTNSYSAQTPETEVLYQFNGNLVESRTYGYEGSGQGTFSSSANTFYRPSVPGTGLFRFVTHLSDNLYDTCDSTDLTCDYLNSASVRFVSNPPENTILYNFYGSGVTKEVQVYTYVGTGSVGISGSHIVKRIKSVVGIGTLNIISTSIEKDVDSYIGSGSIAVLSGSAQAKVSVIPQSTILFSISGISSTRTLKVKTYSGFGAAYFSGSASTKKLSRPSYSGVGTIYLSGQLVYPDIKYVPSPKGSGVININGSGLKNLSRKYISVTQPLFVFSGGFESFSETGYIGVGTIYIQSTSASTINNPYQIPRVYVTII